MLIQIILALLLGLTAGAFTGLVPGIHINLVGVILVSLSVSAFADVNSVYFTVFIVAMAITHTFVDFIPSIFLGAPEDGTELSVLPGHEMLKKGFGYEAIMLTNYGSIIAVFIVLLAAIPSVFFLPKIYGLIERIIPYILILVSLFMIFSEKKKISAFLVFVLCGILGLIVLNTENLNQPLLPLLSGLFGASSLLISIKSKTEIPKQIITNPSGKFYRPVFISFISSYVCGFLPGVGSGQAAAIGSNISKTNTREFLVMLGATNTLVMGFSFLALYSISKTRTGAAAAISDIVGQPSWKILALILAVIIISGTISFFIVKFLAEFFSKNIYEINYTKLSMLTLAILFLIVAVISGFLGLIIFTISSLTGIYCISLEVRRTNMMSCLLLPTIILYLM